MGMFRHLVNLWKRWRSFRNVSRQCRFQTQLKKLSQEKIVVTSLGWVFYAVSSVQITCKSNFFLTSMFKFKGKRLQFCFDLCQKCLVEVVNKVRSAWRTTASDAILHWCGSISISDEEHCCNLERHNAIQVCLWQSLCAWNTKFA